MKRLQRFFFLAMFSAMLAVSGCGGGGGSGGGASSGDGGDPPVVTPPDDGGGGGDNGGGNTPGDSALYTPGEEIILKTATIDDNGGTVAISDTGTWLDGASVTFPAGALPGATEVSVGYDTGTLALPEEVESTGPARTIGVHVEGVTNFNRMVEITVPYEGNADDVPTPFYVDDTGRLHGVVVKNIDTERKTLTFLTAHASRWTYVRFRIGEGFFDLDTGYRPSIDGFQVVNGYRNTIYSKGECAGMSFFSQWYYTEKAESLGGFFPKYMNIVGKNTEGELTGQDVIATRAHTVHDLQTPGLEEYEKEQVIASDEQRWEQIVKTLLATKLPVSVTMTQHRPHDPENYEKKAGYAHQVVVYRVNTASGKLFIYDPNEPGNDAREIEYDLQNKKFRTYAYAGNSFEWFFLIGEGSYNLLESWDNILSDADHDFTSDSAAAINITSHRRGESVAARNIELSGTIESSEVLVTKMDVLVGNTKFTTTVDPNGSFSVPVILNSGENKFRFVTEGLVRPDGGDTHQLIHIPNNLDALPFSLTSTVTPDVMLLTLTWDKPNTDLDLYVIDPTGDYSFFEHKNTADGGELDVDDEDGYGPEHWTLTASDVVRCGGAYRVRVHYFDGNVGTNFKVSLKLYEGTDQQKDFYAILSGYLNVSNEYNAGPFKTGSDWSQDYEIQIPLDSPPCRANP